MIKYKLYLFLLIISSNSLILSINASYNIDDIDKNKPVWTDHTVSLYHQFFLMEAFRPLNVGLCEIENSDYENWINLNKIADPVSKDMPDDFNPAETTEDIFNLTYKANINQRNCGTNENNYVHMVKAHQVDNSEPLYITTYNKNGDVSDTRRELIISEEKTESNPYGVIEHNFGIFGNLSGKGLYLAKTKSEMNEDNTKVEVKSMSLIDYVLLNQNLQAGLVKEMYSAFIIHEIGGGGHGTITSFSWGQYNFSLAAQGLTHGVYPDGIPDIVATTNFAYDDNYLVYKKTFSQTPSSPYVGSQTTVGENICLSRDNYWTYVPDNLGYGVYDINGERVSDNSGFSVSYTQDVEGYGTWNGLLTLSGTGLNIPYVCKNVADGAIVTNDLCSTYGFEYFPLFDVPDGTVLATETEFFYVRQLKPRITYSVEDISNCQNLVIEDTVQTPDHKEFTYLESEIPPSGAILFNQFSENTELDSFYNGLAYIANEDSDGDGVLNFLDAFPNDSAKSKDDDYDGIEDSLDSEVNQAIPFWEKYLDKDLFSNYSH